MKFRNHENTEPTGEFAEAIRDFRAAVTHVAERETARPMAVEWLVPARKRRRSHRHRVVLAWACAAALCFAALPFAPLPFSGHMEPGAAIRATVEPPATPLAQPGEAENGLLQQVDEQVSESVPSSLAPLTEMDSWDTVSASPAGDSSLAGMALALSETTNAH